MYAVRDAAQLTEAGNGVVVARDRGRGSRKLWLTRCEVSVVQDEEVLEVCGTTQYTRAHLTTGDCAL